MDTWDLVKKELKFFGVELINNRKCALFISGEKRVYGTIRAVRILNGIIRKKKEIMKSVWDEITSVLQPSNCCREEIVDEYMVKLFIFSLKDMYSYLDCFSDCDESKYKDLISQSLAQDILLFSKDQIYKIPDYKITVDWIHRSICRLIYIRNLLSFAILGPKKVNMRSFKKAIGVAGPWSRLDLPMEERVFPFGTELENTSKDKQKQRRYRKGFENYNNDGRVGEGHYWRELRNEPFSWDSRGTEDPYPSRHYLSMWG